MIAAPRPIPLPEHSYREQGAAAGFGPIPPGTRKVFILVVAFLSVAFAATVGLWTASAILGDRRGPEESLLIAGIVAMFVMVLFLYGQIAAGLVWLHKAWGWLPWDERYTKHWKGWITPGQASLLMLVPYFHYYWMFVINCGLCDALERLRVRYPTQTPAPKSLAIAACVCQLVVPFPVGTILWLMFMSRVEQMTREMSASAAMAPAR